MLVAVVCAGSECAAPLQPPNGHVEPLQSQYFFKEHVTVTCDPGYLLQKVMMQIISLSIF